MKSQAKIIKNTVNGLYMKNVSDRKGWTKQQAANNVLDYLLCGEKISLFDYMEAK